MPTYFECFVDIEMVCAIQAPSPVAKVRGRSTSFLALYIAIAAVHPVAAQDKMSIRPSCNAPIPYSEHTINQGVA